MKPLGPPPGRPWISTNLAISADGKTSDVASRPSGWTSSADHDRLLELRRSADALMVGRRTLVTDRMTLTCPGSDVQPLRCVVAGKGDVPELHPLFGTTGGPIHWLVTGGPAFQSERFPAGVTLHFGTLTEFLSQLRTELGVNHLHCEGGGTLIRMLAEMDAIDEFHLTLAGHTLFGGLLAPTATGSPADYLPKSRDFRIGSFRNSPETRECFLSFRRHAQ